MAIQINGNGTITGISVGGLPDGIVDTDMIAANAVTSAKSSGLGGLNMVDTWRLITQFINAQGTLGGTSDWERDDTYGNGLIGTGMSQANGYFTFPSTGFYSVKF